MLHVGRAWLVRIFAIIQPASCYVTESRASYLFAPSRSAVFNSSDGSAVPYCVDRDETTYECLPNSEMKNITDWGITIDMAYRLYRVHIGSVSTLST